MFVRVSSFVYIHSSVTVYYYIEEILEDDGTRNDDDDDDDFHWQFFFRFPSDFCSITYAVY